MVINKPWGQEEVLERNEHYMVKRLTMRKGHCCSLQYHEKKTETLYLLEGKVCVYIGNDRDSMIKKRINPGDSLTLPPGILHRIEGITDAVFLEASTPEMEDVVRLEDRYNRIQAS